MRIYVPSMDRVNKINEGPLRQMTKQLLTRTTYVVPSDQTHEYRRKLNLLNYAEVGLLACPEDGIARTRHFIGGDARGSGADKFLMLDDDIKFVRRVNPSVTQLVECDFSDVERLMNLVEITLDNYAHVGISARGGNNHAGVGPSPLIQENTRTLRALAYRTDDFLSVKHGRVEVMEDFDVNLQLLRAGRPNANICYYAQDQRMTNEEGGCSTYRSHEVHERSAEKLAELHAPFVKLRIKKNKTDADGFGTRKEVTIQWKKAFASSQE